MFYTPHVPYSYQKLTEDRCFDHVQKNVTKFTVILVFHKYVMPVKLQLRATGWVTGELGVDSWLGQRFISPPELQQWL
jgi:hypothetical protein